jgi:hypothetical protein
LSPFIDVGATLFSKEGIVATFWIPFVQLTALALVLAVFWHFGQELNLSGRLLVIYHAAVIGLTVIGLVRVLVRLYPSGLCGSGGSSAPSSAQETTQPQQRDLGE